MGLVSIISLLISLLAVGLLWKQSTSKLAIIATGIILCVYLFGAFWNGHLIAVNSKNYQALALSGMLKDIFGTIEIPLMFTVLFNSLKKND